MAIVRSVSLDSDKETLEPFASDLVRESLNSHRICLFEDECSLVRVGLPSAGWMTK